MTAVRDAINGSGPTISGAKAYNYVELHDEAWPSSGGQRMVKTIDPVAPSDDVWAKGRQKLAHGLLFVAPGVQLVDTPQFPAEWKQGALAAREALNWIRAEDTLDWTFLSPAILLQPGERTGQYRLGTESPLMAGEQPERVREFLATLPETLLADAALQPVIKKLEQIEEARKLGDPVALEHELALNPDHHEARILLAFEDGFDDAAVAVQDDDISHTGLAHDLLARSQNDAALLDLGAAALLREPHELFHQVAFDPEADRARQIAPRGDSILTLNDVE